MYLFNVLYTNDKYSINCSNAFQHHSNINTKPLYLIINAGIKNVKFHYTPDTCHISVMGIIIFCARGGIVDHVSHINYKTWHMPNINSYGVGNIKGCTAESRMYILNSVKSNSAKLYTMWIKNTVIWLSPTTIWR